MAYSFKKFEYPLYTLLVGDCGELASIPNGSIKYIDGNHTAGSVATYECDLGYYLHGNCQRYCQQVASQDGQVFFQWTGSRPRCIGMC